ncbi:MAG TPA: uroporphyrinogen decarboxylase [Elusimicrobiota bacterium]|nr:uroporphyrinogen decarboxylase [Elusimicrobiota bacterium]
MNDILYQSRFLKACRREKTDVTPVWLMRQAGRYMKSYRALRAKHSFLEMCRTPELAARVTVDAVDQLGVDAAILFSDILLILQAFGRELRYESEVGPVVTPALTEARLVGRLPRISVDESLGFVFEAVRLARAGLPPSLPLIGFAGAPFTLAAYLIEGGKSHQFVKTRSFMYQHPAEWDRLMGKLSDATSDYLRGQIDAGVQAVQVFDSWVGCLSPADYRNSVLPYTERIVASVRSRVPVIYFGTQTAALLPWMKKTGCDVMGLDWRVDLKEEWDRLGRTAVMGNLDPAVLLASRADIKRNAEAILRSVAGRPGHIFNLGHGVLPTTPPDHVKYLVDVVHRFSGARSRLS